MTDPLVPEGDGYTVLTDDDLLGLVPEDIITRGELNAAEQANILIATLGRVPSCNVLLDDLYLRRLHSRMLGEVWQWAGSYRFSETNIGIDPANISGAVVDLVADVRAWIDHDSYQVDEICIRFHHRLVAIHPFPNGNGRHGRLAADYLARALGTAPFSWGSGSDSDPEQLRKRYRVALQVADRGDFSPLVEFSRS